LVRGQRTEDRRKKTEDGRQKAEYRIQKAVAIEMRDGAVWGFWERYGQF